MKTIAFIGGGRITKIILQAFANKNLKFERIFVYDPVEETLGKLKNCFTDIEISHESLYPAFTPDVLFLAVHPPVMAETLQKIKPSLKPETILISLAPKVTIAKMTEILGGFSTIARVNPSATSYINDGINPVAFGPGMNEKARKQTLELLGNLGQVPVVSEDKIEAYALISAMGSTYFWFQIQELKRLALKFGMEETEANQTISEMLKGSAATLFNSGLTPAEVMDLVPVKPLAEYEEPIKSYYDSKLSAIYEKIKP
ncbi:MAG TPA: NAD(P)-binding domain-containing protein [Bacteroidales bacterium]|nr:NAD(P)-binding domain-containing protein [Bacteroidales bacterium]